MAKLQTKIENNTEENSGNWLEITVWSFIVNLTWNIRSASEKCKVLKTSNDWKRCVINHLENLFRVNRHILSACILSLHFNVKMNKKNSTIHFLKVYLKQDICRILLYPILFFPLRFNGSGWWRNILKIVHLIFDLRIID